MKTGTCYFYSDQSKLVKSDNSGFMVKHYTVFGVNIFNGNIDEAERKARTVNDKLRFGRMPGGYFFDRCKPYNFDKIYTVITIRDNTKIQRG